MKYSVPHSAQPPKRISAGRATSKMMSPPKDIGNGAKTSVYRKKGTDVFFAAFAKNSSVHFLPHGMHPHIERAITPTPQVPKEQPAVALTQPRAAWRRPRPHRRASESAEPYRTPFAHLRCCVGFCQRHAVWRRARCPQT